MKRFLVLVTVAVIAISLVAGCVGEVKTYTDSGQTIDIGVGQEFVIALGANPTTGYDWEIGEVKTYIDSGQTIGIGVGQEFVIVLGANPTTGYDWEVSLDETILELVEKTYKLAEEAEHEIVGAGGVDYFRFKALKAGEAEITLVYKRSWEEEGIDQKVFTVDID
jgi:inhibitor of cysteine peptidase